MPPLASTGCSEPCVRKAICVAKMNRKSDLQFDRITRSLLFNLVRMVGLSAALFAHNCILIHKILYPLASARPEFRERDGKRMEVCSWIRRLPACGRGCRDRVSSSVAARTIPLTRGRPRPASPHPSPYRSTFMCRIDSEWGREHFAVAIHYPVIRLTLLFLHL